MVEEHSISSAEIVEPLFAIRCRQKTILGAFAITRVPDLATTTVFRQRQFLGITKLLLTTGIDEVFQRNDIQISQQVIRFNIMIAAIDVSVVLHSESSPAPFAKDTQRRFNANPRTQCLIENLHEDAADVLFDPLVKNIAKKPSELLRQHTP